MGFTRAMRFTALTIVGLCVAGLLWRGFGIYQADQRAQQAAALARSEDAGAEGETRGGGDSAAKAASPEPPAPPAAPDRPKLVVHVEGAVHRPGVYTFEEGARVNDAVLAAGGALPEGRPGALNLAAYLTDGAKIYVYTEAELQPPAPVQAARPADQPAEARAASYSPVKSTQEAASSAATKQQKASSPVNINTATAAELEAVPGIGPATARAIVEYRTRRGAFGKVDDLTAVAGIGPKTLEKLRPYLKV